MMNDETRGLMVWAMTLEDETADETKSIDSYGMITIQPNTRPKTMKREIM